MCGKELSMYCENIIRSSIHFRSMQIFICLQKQMVCGRSFDTYLNLFHVNTCTKINRQIPIATSDDAANDSLRHKAETTTRALIVQHLHIYHMFICRFSIVKFKIKIKSNE